MAKTKVSELSIIGFNSVVVCAALYIGWLMDSLTTISHGTEPNLPAPGCFSIADKLKIGPAKVDTQYMADYLRDKIGKCDDLAFYLDQERDYSNAGFIRKLRDEHLGRIYHSASEMAKSPANEKQFLEDVIRTEVRHRIYEHLNQIMTKKDRINYFVDVIDGRLPVPGISMPDTTISEAQTIQTQSHRETAR